jgi:hypothetical protein
MNKFKPIATTARLLLVAATTTLAAAPASADIDLRVVSRPIAGPIDAYIRVTDDDGRAITDLAKANFAVKLDGAPLKIGAFGLPLARDAAQKKSIVFYMGGFDYPLDDLARFIRHMEVAEFAAIVRDAPKHYQQRVGCCNGDVLDFTMIDGGAGTDRLVEELSTQLPWCRGWPDMRPFYCDPAGVMQAINQFGHPLPKGPKAIVMLTNSEYGSQSEVVAHANANRVPIFTVNFDVDDVEPDEIRVSLLTTLADDTGGAYVRGKPDFALAEVASLLNDAYRLTFPQATITDCNPHVLEVSLPGLADQSASIPFARCDTTPEPFSFEPVIGVTPGSFVVSNAVAIAGIESPVAIEVFDGKYSIGCGETFTSVSGFLYAGDSVCVRHPAATSYSTQRQSILVVGGVAGTFQSETGAAPAEPPPPPPPPSPPPQQPGGGGAAGVIELLLWLGALLAARCLVPAIPVCGGFVRSLRGG